MRITPPRAMQNNPLGQVVQSILSDAERTREIVDTWTSFVIHNCFDEKTVQASNFTGMIYNFARLCASPENTISLSVLGITVLPDTVIPYQMLRAQELDLCIHLVRHAETYFARVKTRSSTLVLEGYRGGEVMNDGTRGRLIRCFLWNMLLARALCFYDRTNRRMTPYTSLSLSYLKIATNNVLYLIRSDPSIGLQERRVLMPALSDFAYDIHLLTMAL